jgi:hypothetical protein
MSESGPKYLIELRINALPSKTKAAEGGPETRVDAGAFS